MKPGIKHREREASKVCLNAGPRLTFDLLDKDQIDFPTYVYGEKQQQQKKNKNKREVNLSRTIEVFLIYHI